MGISKGAYGQEMGLNLLAMDGRTAPVHGQNSHGLEALSA